MIELDFATAANIMHGDLRGGRAEGARFRGVSIDSRTAHQGELFFAIKGAAHDGHRFVDSALAAGAAGAVVSDPLTTSDRPAPQLLVTDTHQALIELARWRRTQLQPHTIGVTGSTGKTTVKEMIGFLLRRAGQATFVSAGNLNNLYGLPLSLLRMPDEQDTAVFELGISVPGEMSALAPILQPAVGVITNISATHLETLGSVAGVRAEKLSLLDHLQPNGAAVVNAGDSELVAGARQRSPLVITFSADPSVSADVAARDVTLTADGRPHFTLNGRNVTLRLFGAHQAENAACAVAACQALGVDVDPQTLSEFTLTGAALRGETVERHGVTFILDCYNANPASMNAGLASFAAYHTTGGKILVLGDMLELGATEEQEHRNIGRAVAQRFSQTHGPAALTGVITVGALAALIAEEYEKAAAPATAISSHENAASAAAALREIATPGAIVYLKASRGMALERIVEEFSRITDRINEESA
ncbi:MAG TPA: UDP-N-acetylmuramoyl-tripeptide--D-alanyl-D-alanine ligase [candidate division Zixibacteria bacterium]|nr:UDP-N-acetylmuramoyl-tripeptide--D-alanyl-D-alanine ligase [candidate division Zixibacteria bacterium]